MMKNDVITLKVKKGVSLKLGIAVAAIAALVLAFLAYSFFFDLDSEVADGLDRAALVSIQNELNENGYLTSLRTASATAYSGDEEIVTTDEYYRLCVSVAQRKAASEYLNQKYPDGGLDISFTNYP
ncbi:MAG: hypothetical protein NC084_01965 [Bacteroides sp.]|nr:hypothetical protein [Eubacterium sp.]MCM1417347.1 hypothetical protein [Roseburia sp.]MCM1461460.1 hypothetical protein [Bacteroides sp.]